MARIHYNPTDQKTDGGEGVKGEEEYICGIGCREWELKLYGRQERQKSSKIERSFEPQKDKRKIKER